MGKGGSKHVIVGRAYQVERVVGRGAFGKVHCIQDVETKILYAIKVMNKERILEKGEKVINGTIREKDMLYEVNHPLIVNLLAHGQDEWNLYMILDLMLGGELDYHLQARKKGEGWKEEELRFYAMQVLCTLAYLHNDVHIIHRDIKPQNILLDGNGNAHLTDFNVSMNCEPGEKVSGFSGTKGYMAPEILKDEPYDHRVDIWSLGIILYRMMKEFPWKSSKTREDLVEETKKVVDLDYPDTFSEECRDCVKQMLQYDMDQRPTSKELMDHKWFEGVDWEEVPKKKTKSPVVIKEGKAHVDQRMMLDEYMRDQAQADKKKKRPLLSPADDAKFAGWEKGPKRLEGELPEELKKKIKHNPL